MSKKSSKKKNPTKDVQTTDVAEPVVEEHIEQQYKPTMYLTSLIARYRDGELPLNSYKLIKLSGIPDDVPFDVLISSDLTMASKSLMPAYLLKANKKYTNKKYTVILNAHVYNSMGQSNHIFIVPFLSTLHPALLPEFSYDSDGKCLYDLNLDSDILATFINTCNLNPILKGQRINYKSQFGTVQGFFNNALNKSFSNPNELLKEVKDDDLYE